MEKKKYSKFENFQFWLLVVVVPVAIFVIGYFTGVEITEHKMNEKYGNMLNEILYEVKTPTEKTTDESADEPTEPQFVSLGMFKATAYCPCVECCGKTDGITATGVKAKAGRTVAVDPNVIPYGTKIIINGHTYIAEDKGGDIVGNKVDIFFDTHEEAEEHGIKYVEVFVKK